MILANENGIVNSLQVSRLINIPAGNFNMGRYFLIKNITDNNIKIQVRPAGQSEFIETTLYPGWNPELVYEIKNVSVNTLQAGY